MPRGLKGFKQNLDVEMEAVQRAQDHLEMLLLEKWAWGSLPAPRLQELASASKQDGLTSKLLLDLASTGTSGKHPQHLHRDFLRHLGDIPVKPQAISVLMLHQEAIPVQHDLQVLFPHQLFATLYHHDPNAWKQATLGKDAAAQAFWTQCSYLRRP